MYLKKEEEIHRNPPRGGHINMEAEIGGIHIQTRDCWEPLEAKKQEKTFPLEPSEEVEPF